MTFKALLLPAAMFDPPFCAMSDPPFFALPPGRMLERDPSSKGIVFSQFNSFLELIYFR